MRLWNVKVKIKRGRICPPGGRHDAIKSAAIRNFIPGFVLRFRFDNAYSTIHVPWLVFMIQDAHHGIFSYQGGALLRSTHLTDRFL